MKFKHLNVPDSWERYFTKYPQGMTILEALFEWVAQVDSMVDNQNKLNDNVAQFRNEIDDFVARFDERLQTEVINTLKDWQDSGFLNVVIGEALQWELDTYIATNEQDKLLFTEQLQQYSWQVPPSTGGNDTEMLKDILNKGGKITFSQNQTYYVNEILIDKETVIDLNGSTLRRFTKPSRFIFDVTKSITMFNGTLDGENIAVNTGHLMRINGADVDVHIFDVTFLNNVNSYPNPINTKQDTDHVYIDRARDVLIENCVFKKTSRQGISLTNKFKTFKSLNNSFEDCYLFGIDIEFNNASTLMCESVTIFKNDFINCGVKSSTDYVWNSGGPIGIHYAHDQQMNVIKNIEIDFNRFIGDDFIQVNDGMVAPHIRVQSYETLSFTHNIISNIERVVLGVGAHPAIATNVSQNILNSTEPHYHTNIYVEAFGQQIVSNNILERARIHARNTDKFLKIVGQFDLKNNIKNGDFSNGLTGWTVGNLIPNTIVNANEYLSIFGNGSTTSNLNNGVTQKGVFSSLDTYYVSVKASKYLGDDSTLFLSQGYTPIAQFEVTRDMVRYSKVIKPTSIETTRADLFIGADPGVNINVDNVVVLNLTKVFGTGNEPTKEQMDVLMDGIPAKILHI